MQTSLNPLAGDMVRERLNALYGLDRPLWEQYTRTGSAASSGWTSAFPSPATRAPSWKKIMERMPLTVGMNVISLLLTLLISIPIGIVSAVRRGSLLDRALTVLVCFSALPCRASGWPCCSCSISALISAGCRSPASPRSTTPSSRPWERRWTSHGISPCPFLWDSWAALRARRAFCAPPCLRCSDRTTSPRPEPRACPQGSS